MQTINATRAIELLWKTCVRTIQGEASEDLKADARQVLFDLISSFGPGYAFDEPLQKIHGKCNICGAEFEGWTNEDLVTCAHIPGREYGGETCTQIVDKIIEFKELNLRRAEPNMMDLPEERIWPWMVGMPMTIHTQSSSFDGSARLNQEEFAGQKFWFGVAHIPGLNQDLGQFQIAFDNGRKGLAHSGATGSYKEGVAEVSFVGITTLDKEREEAALSRATASISLDGGMPKVELRITFDKPWTDMPEPTQPPQGVTVSYHERLRESADVTTTLVLGLVVGFVSGVPASMVAAWLYDQLRKRNTARIRIDQEEIDVNQGEIERIVRTKMEINKP